MGENMSVQSKKSAQQMLQFVQLYQDQNFGSIEIFRFKQPPYEYIMDYCKNFIQEETKIQDYRQYIKSIQSMDHKNLAKIHFFQAKEEKNMCIISTKTHAYYNYYNFTLYQAIQKKKKTSSSFPQNDLLYIISCLVSLASYLKQHKVFLGQYRAKRVYISPQGYIKIYLLQMQKQNKHNCYYKVLSQKALFSQYILAPQQLKYIQNMEYELKFDLQKADIFAIGMLILQLLTLDDPKFFYNQKFTTVLSDKINFTLQSYKKYYTQRFLQLLKCCLETDPKKRISFEVANQKIQQCKKHLPSLSYCIKLQDDQQNFNKKKDILQEKNKNPFLSLPSGLEKRLTPAPITTFSHHQSTKITTPLTTLSSKTSSNLKPINSTKNSSKRQSFNSQGQKTSYTPMVIRSGPYQSLANKQKINNNN